MPKLYSYTHTHTVYYPQRQAISKSYSQCYNSHICNSIYTLPEDDKKLHMHRRRYRSRIHACFRVRKKQPQDNNYYRCLYKYIYIYDVRFEVLSAFRIHLFYVIFTPLPHWRRPRNSVCVSNVRSASDYGIISQRVRLMVTLVFRDRNAATCNRVNRTWLWADLRWLTRLKWVALSCCMRVIK